MLREIKGVKFSGISDDSRSVKKGDIFFAIQGSRFDGCRFIGEAIKKGAVCVVTDKDFKPSPSQRGKVKIIRVDHPRITLARFASDFYKKPSRKLKVIGITGTNGKTTVSYLLAAILKRAGFETGIVGTISYNWGYKFIEARNTTPGSIELQRILSQMVSDGVRYCAMEVSSHSLDQDRVLGIDFKTAIFTNITGEHLDYHKTFEDYIEAKAKLFRNLRARSLTILNADDENYKKIKKGTCAKVLTYGINNKADMWADEIKTDLGKTEFLVRTKDDSFRLKSPMVGIFNVYNILAGVAAVLNEGVPLEVIREAVSDFKGAEGRLEAVEFSGDFKIFIDYAHTDNALKNVLETLRKVSKKRLIVVFGCGGDRDRLKRPRMGNVASTYSDEIIITSDNPRSENPLDIAKEVEKGIGKKFKSYKIILDRFEAVNEAVNIARAGDIVLIAGKGHEKYQIVGDKYLPFSDRDVVKKILSKNRSVKE